jgi:predicted metal-dependent phosphoesterase TrpH
MKTKASKTIAVTAPSRHERSRDGADLHVHTTHSDGVCSPCEVVVAAARVGLAALAITDHDTVSALAVARPEAARWGVELIGGVELTCGYEGRELHILGHFIRDDDRGLLEAMAELRAGRKERLLAITERLTALGLSIDEKALRVAYPRAVLGRRHVAEYLAGTGQVASVRDAFLQYLGDGRPACVDKHRLDAGRAITLISAAGGVAALAHPPMDLRESTLRALVGLGLRAIEVDGPGISRSLSRRIQGQAIRLDLIGIAGSDFHAHDRPGRWIGAITTPRDVLERLRSLSRTDQQPPNDQDAAAGTAGSRPRDHDGSRLLG